MISYILSLIYRYIGNRSFHGTSVLARNGVEIQIPTVSARHSRAPEKSIRDTSPRVNLKDCVHIKDRVTPFSRKEILRKAIF